MRKIYVLIGLCLVMVGLSGNFLLGYANDVDVTDYEIAMMHATKVYGEDDYKIIILDDTDDECIHYECSNGYLRYDARIDRDINYDILTGYYNEIQD